MSERVKTILRNIETGAFILVVVAMTLIGQEWLLSHFTPRELSSEEVPEYIQLKTEPENVLHAESYKNGENNEIRYAYVTEKVSAKENEAVDRRTSNSQTSILNVVETETEKVETLKTTFYSSPQFYKDGEDWLQIEYATTTPEVFAASGAIRYVQKREWWERVLPGEPLFAQTSTFYPDADPETNSIDGTLGNFNADWSTARNGSRGFAEDTAVGVSSEELNGTALYAITRGVVLFDTSSLPDDVTVTAATLGLKVDSVDNTDNDGDDTLNVVSVNPASNTELLSTDYNSFGSTLFSSAVDVTGVTVETFVEFDLNSTGLSNVIKTGVTKLGLREGHDLNDTTIADNSSSAVIFKGAETAGTTEDPYLEVTYSNVIEFSSWGFFPF